MTHPPQEERVGIELEKLLLDQDTLMPLPLEGSRSIQTILEGLVERFGWIPHKEAGPIISLQRDQELISLEPGGQIEFSASKSHLVDHAADMEKLHLSELNAIVADWNILWSGLGMQPVANVDEVDWVTKARYRHMRSYFQTLGSSGQSMMKMTSSVQVSLDYQNEEDAARKIRLASKLSPVWVAMFANSCISEGRLNGYKSYRSHIWQNTDPWRCGLPQVFFKKDFSFKDYVEYAMQAPLFYIKKGDETFGGLEMTFRDFMNKGFQGHAATLSDWQQQLTCLFPEVRLRTYVEFRSCDRQTGRLSYAIPALMKYLFYNPEALTALEKMTTPLEHGDCALGLKEAAKDGLEGRLGSRKLLDWAKEIMALASSSVSWMKKEGKTSTFEEDSLRAVHEMICDDEMCPADYLIREIEGADRCAREGVVASWSSQKRT